MRRVGRPLRRLRSEDPVDVRARNDGARDPGAPLGALWHRDLAEPDLNRHRRGGRRGHQVAGTAARCRVADRLPRCGGAQDPRAGRGAEQAHLSRARDQRRGQEGSARGVARGERRRQVLAQGDHRAQEPRGAGHFLVCCDGLKGFPQAIEAVFPKTVVQTCIVHLIRSSTRFVAWINRKTLIADLKRVYRAETEEAAVAALVEFEKRRGERYLMVAQAWRSNWERVRPFFAFGAEIRRIISTINAIESLNYSLRKITRARGHFPHDEAALKLVYLVIRNVEKKWTRQPQYWTRALNQFAIHFEGRLPT
ncbi:MAG: hypothetical protein E6K80_15125 [Candidatus Eisenbacteria bacterium]|uniref:Mutator family transposase n=1 Tax=Eiseniibacteriota bacterium TaxID=2212470 RepID=A0A538TVD1_UNCEI|nr:MAG: hypothetical protein E6K80_15125 [Candidatus Eisenbacteria bacterium]